jgi:hypothetical protein
LLLLTTRHQVVPKLELALPDAQYEPSWDLQALNFFFLLSTAMKVTFGGKACRAGKFRLIRGGAQHVPSYQPCGMKRLIILEPLVRASVPV